MRRSVPLLVLVCSILLGSSCSIADQSADQRNAAIERAKQDYKVYLQGLKTISEQYKGVTNAVKEVMKEEGIPAWDDQTGGIKMVPYTETKAAAPASGPDQAIVETDTDMTLSIDVPGLKKGSIKAVIKDGRTLQITGKRKKLDEELDVEKVIALPAAADEGQTRAEYQDGVLTVKMKKAAQKEVPITVR